MARARFTTQVSAHCRRITIRRRKRGGKVLPVSQWKQFVRCDNRKLHAHNRRQCRNRKKLFVKCR